MNFLIKSHLTPLVESRLRELDAERAALLKEFPHLRPEARTTRKEHRAPKEKPPSKRRRLSKEERAEVSERMKKYWAAHPRKKGDSPVGDEPATETHE